MCSLIRVQGRIIGTIEERRSTLRIIVSKFIGELSAKSQASELKCGLMVLNLNLFRDCFRKLNRTRSSDPSFSLVAIVPERANHFVKTFGCLPQGRFTSVLLAIRQGRRNLPQEGSGGDEEAQPRRNVCCQLPIHTRPTIRGSTPGSRAGLEPRSGGKSVAVQTIVKACQASIADVAGHGQLQEPENHQTSLGKR